MRFLNDNAKRILAWVFSIWSFISAFAFPSVLCRVIFILAGIASLPINPIKYLWNKVPEKVVKFKVLAIALVYFVGICLSTGYHSEVGQANDTNKVQQVTNNSTSQKSDTKKDKSEVEKDKDKDNNEKKENIVHEKDSNEDTKNNNIEQNQGVIGQAPVSLSDIPAYSGNAYVAINGNVPYFNDSELSTSSYENYSALDSLGRCGVAVASVGRDIMPTKERGSIGSVKPTGWHTVKYDNVDGKYLYNRCHLLGYQLTGENANPQNLITGTRYLNVEGMLPFENMIADYVKETGNHVLYRVTPIFEGNNLLASGVLLEAKSVEDNGAGVLFNVYAYNVQPGIVINYATGESNLDNNSTVNSNNSTYSSSENNNNINNNNVSNSTNNNSSNVQNNEQTVAPPQVGTTYVVNTNTKKFHNPSCSSVKRIKAENYLEISCTHDEAVAQGYDPCKNCNP